MISTRPRNKQTLRQVPNKHHHRRRRLHPILAQRIPNLPPHEPTHPRKTAPRMAQPHRILQIRHRQTHRLRNRQTHSRSPRRSRIRTRVRVVVRRRSRARARVHRAALDLRPAHLRRETAHRGVCGSCALEFPRRDDYKESLCGVGGRVYGCD